MLIQKMRNWIVVVGLCVFSFTAFAEDQVAKQETTPPPANGPLTAEQIPPING